MTCAQHRHRLTTEQKSHQTICAAFFGGLQYTPDPDRPYDIIITARPLWDS